LDTNWASPVDNSTSASCGCWPEPRAEQAGHHREPGVCPAVLPGCLFSQRRLLRRSAPLLVHPAGWVDESPRRDVVGRGTGTVGWSDGHSAGMHLGCELLQRDMLPTVDHAVGVDLLIGQVVGAVMDEYRSPGALITFAVLNFVERRSGSADAWELTAYSKWRGLSVSSGRTAGGFVP
jgi:hypothetical protein